MITKYETDIRRVRERVAAVPSHTLASSWGPIEYTDQGTGTPLLLSHGVYGGHTNTRDLVDLWIGPGHRAIGPSRFGYLGSALPANATPADQADAYAALLDHLGIDRVAAVGVSAGGPATIQFALRHPGRLYGLILLSSYLPGMAHPLPLFVTPAMRAVAGWQFGWWLLEQWRPGALGRIMGVPKGWDASRDKEFLALRETLFPVDRKKDGVAFDACVSEPASNDFPLEDITVPALLVHAADDRLAPYERVPKAAARIPGARLVTIESGGHLFLGHQDQVRDATASFIDGLVRNGQPPRALNAS